jgi:hypothetical protein
MIRVTKSRSEKRGKVSNMQLDEEHVARLLEVHLLPGTGKLLPILQQSISQKPHKRPQLIS